MRGTIEAVSGSVVDVRFSTPELPSLREALTVIEPASRTLEVQSHPKRGLVRSLALQGSSGLRRGLSVEATGEPLSVPVGEALLGRVVDCLGRPLDGGPPIAASERRALHQRAPALHRHSPRLEPLETGLKIVDLLCPFARGGKTGLFGGAGVGKTVLLMEFINSITEKSDGLAARYTGPRRSG